ncbi:MAG: hypothetical protein GF398_01520 [Chitinivibrionales bacterium]|nr:hypothetical protein [Chitinivibrionales bacterium]
MRNGKLAVATIVGILITTAIFSQPAIDVLAPATGEQYYAGDTVWIKWTAQNLVQSAVYIEYSPDAGTTWEAINTEGIGTTDSDWGNYPWVPQIKCPTDKVIINIGEYEGTFVKYSGMFSYDFKEPTISILEPTWGKRFDAGDTVWIEWCTAQLTNDAVTIEYSTDDGASWDGTVADIVAATDDKWGRYPWVPAMAENADRAKVLITATDSSVETVSPRFRIAGGAIPVRRTSPPAAMPIGCMLKGRAFNVTNPSGEALTLKLATPGGRIVYAGTINAHRSHTIPIPSNGACIASIGSRSGRIKRTVRLPAITSGSAH